MHIPEEWIMTKIVLIKQQTPPAPTGSAGAAPTIALRKTCSPDGVGLSHYVLMDKKVAR